MAGSVFLEGIGELATPVGFSARRGSAMSELRVVSDACILAIDGVVRWAGLASEAPEPPAGVVSVDAGGRAVVPGFVDSHAHFVFGGFRADEFYWRADGLPYMEIHARGGGIRRSVDATRAASFEELAAIGGKRLDTALSLGVTTMEGKSGYGLDRDTELRQLEVMRQLSERHPIDIVPTYMGPHSVPPEFAGKPSAYVDFCIETVLPEVARRGLARFADVFCEKGVFELEDSRRFLEAAARAGLGLKMHADEIVRIGGAGLAAELGATSADHLLKASAEDIAAMSASGTVATVLPLTAFSLREPYADARGMIDAGCAVALASDLNPGSCYSQAIPLAFALAVLQMRMSPEEALCAATLNGAAALGMADSVGSIEAGKKADFLILDAPSHLHLAYHVGMNQVRSVYKSGVLVHGPK
ncbi:MAG: imidazolonepropionase [Spirochaetales bacterium]|nr:imidazolonepropionase [Spirochaetales bacterium]